MLINSAINPFRKELIHVLTKKNPNTFLKHFVRRIENLTWVSSLGLSSIASIIHLATATFAIVSVSTGPLFIAVVLTGTALAAIAVVLAIATAILHQKFSAPSQKTKLIEPKKTDLSEIKIKRSCHPSTVQVSEDIESDAEESYDDSDLSSESTSSEETSTVKEELKQKVLELKKTVMNLENEIGDRKIIDDTSRILAELTRRHKLITELESSKVELTVENASLKAELKEEEKNKRHLQKEIDDLHEKLKNKTDFAKELKEKKHALKEKLKAEIAAKAELKEELKHIGEFEKIAENLIELNAHSTNLKSLLELQAQAIELASQRDSGPDSPRRKQLLENYLAACVEIQKLKMELAKYKKENSSLTRSSPVPPLKLKNKKEKKSDKLKSRSKKRKISPSPSLMQSTKLTQEPVLLAPAQNAIQSTVDTEGEEDWEVLNPSPRSKD